MSRSLGLARVPASLAFGLMVAVATAACGGDSGGVPADDVAGGDAADAGDVRDADDTSDGSGEAPESRVEYRLAEEAVLLEGDALAAIVANEDDGATLRFDPAAFAELGIVEGSVIVATVGPNTPVGLLRQVTSVDSSGEEVVVSTTQAALTDAFAQLDLDLYAALDADEIPFGSAAGGANKDSDSGGQVVTFGGPFEWVVFDGDGDPATDDDRVLVSGNMGASANYYFGLSYDLGILDSILSGDFPPDIDPTDIDLRAGFSIGASVALDVMLSGRAALGFEKEVPLGEKYLGAIVVGPLVFVPVVRATGVIEGSVPGSFQIGAGATAGFGASVEYVAGDGFRDDFSAPHIETTDPTADVELGASARARIDIDVALLLYGIIGPKAGLGLWVGAEANVFDEPCWRASTGLDAYLGLLIELFTVELADWEKRWPIGEYEIGSGSCETGQAVDPAPPVSRAWVGSANSTAPSDRAVASLTPAIDGTHLLTGSESLVIAKVADTGDWLWSRSFVFHGVLDTPLEIASAVTRNDAGIAAVAGDDFVLRLDAAGALESALQVETGSSQPGDPVGVIGDGANGAWFVTPYFDETGNDVDVLLVHARADGSVSTVRWGRPDWDERPRAIVDWGGRIAVISVAQNFDADPDTESWLTVFDAAGNQTGAWRFSDCAGVDDVAMNTATVNEDGNLVVGGYGRFAAPRALLVAVRPDGTVAWDSAHRSGDLLGYSISSILQLPGGAFLVAGTRLYAAPDDAFVARTDSVGNLVWAWRLGGTGAEVAPALALLPDGNALLATVSGSFGELQSSWWISRFDARTGAIAIGAGQPVSTGSDAFHPDDFCVSTTAGTVPTVPHAVTVSTPDVEALGSNYPATSVGP